MSEIRLIRCETCGSEGRIMRNNGSRPYDRDCGPCSVCEGTGYEIIKVEMVNEFDHIELDESGLARSNF